MIATITLNPDTLISAEEQDRFGRYPLAVDLGRSIHQWQGSSALVVGIIGDWGSGKSSFIEFIRTELLRTTPSTPVLKFNPWMFTGQQDLVARFFQFLAEAIKLSLPGTKYASITKRLEAIGEGFSLAGRVSSISAFVAIGGAFKGPEQAAKQLQSNLELARRALEQGLNETGQTLVVSIDDIDRLTKDEIRQIFQLVKLTANFPRTVYLLAFDEQAAADALQLEWGQRFHEKVVQVPVHLPSPSRPGLRDFLFEQIGTVAYRNGFDWPGQLKGDFGVVLTELYGRWPVKRMRVPRDAIRLANALSVSLPRVVNDVNLVDFVAVEMLRTWEPAVYQRVSSSRWDLVRSEAALFGRTEDSRARITEILPDLEEYTDFLSALFDRGVNRPGSTGDKRICDERYVHRYFEWSVNRVADVTDSEAREAISLLIEDETEDAERFLDGMSPVKLRRMFEEIQNHIPHLNHEERLKLGGALLQLGHLSPVEHITTAFSGESANIRLIQTAFSCWNNLASSTEWKTGLMRAADRVEALATLTEFVQLLLRDQGRGTFTEMAASDIEEVHQYLLNKVSKAIEEGMFHRICQPSVVVWDWARNRGDWVRIRDLIGNLLARSISDGRCALRLLTHRRYSATDRVTEHINPADLLIQELGGIGNLAEPLKAFRAAHGEELVSWEIEVIEELLTYDNHPRSSEW